MKKLIIILGTISINVHANGFFSGATVKEYKPDGLTSAERHKKICEEVGGVEPPVGETNIQLSAGAIDGGVCITKMNKNNIQKPIESNLPNIKVIKVDTSDIADPMLYLGAPAGSVPYPAEYNASGLAYYKDFPAGRVFWKLGIPDNNCATSGALVINGDYKVEPWIHCRTLVRGSVQSYMQGCFNDKCWYAYGTINQG